MSDDVNTHPGLLELMRADWAAICRASKQPSTFLFTQYFAAAAYRISNALWRRGNRRLGRVSMLIAQVLTGAEISGAASIGPGLRFTHTAGIVVGSGVTAGRDLTLYAGVLLGNHSPGRAGSPTLGDNVRVCSKATILGPVSIGDRAFIGAHALVVDDVPADGKVYAPVAVAR
jgi:serine O-acetyltransferase